MNEDGTMQNEQSGSGEVKRDEGLDVLAAYRATKAEPTKPELKMDTPPNALKPEEKKLSSLDRAILAKKNTVSGLETDEKAAEMESGQKRLAWDSDESREEFDEKLAEVSDDAAKAQRVICIKKPTNQAEFAKMICEINMTTLDSEGNAIVPEGAEFIYPKTPEIIAEIERRKAEDSVANGENGDGKELMDVDAAKREYKDSIVKILIDKTGLGANIEFDDEEKKVIERANVIQLCEVEDEELRLVDIDRTDDDTPFMQLVEAQQISLSKVPMCFPSSGFKAQMTGLSLGEHANITLDTEAADAADYLNFNKLYMRYSVIYNNMKNISVGPFKDFNEFLHKFAADDLPLALYGLVVASQPEIDTLNMTCTRKGCEKHFVYSYAPRRVIDFDTAPVAMLEMIDKIASASPDEMYTLYKNSRVNKFKRLKLNRSRYLADLGAASAWDHLYYILPVVQKYDKLEKEEGFSDMDPRVDVPLLLYGVRKMYVPSIRIAGAYVQTETGDDVADAYLSLPNSDALALKAGVEAYRKQFTVGFSLKDIECPHCHTMTRQIPIDVDTLVFQIRLRQLSTRVTVKNFPDF